MLICSTINWIFLFTKLRVDKIFDIFVDILQFTGYDGLWIRQTDAFRHTCSDKRIPTPSRMPDKVLVRGGSAGVMRAVRHREQLTEGP